MQELPNAHKLVRLYCLPLHGRHAEVVSAAVRDEGALRMRHTPCGCAPYGESAFHIRRARPLGVPSAKRQTVVPARDCHGRKRPLNDRGVPVVIAMKPFVGLRTCPNTENRLKYSFQSVFNAVPALHFRDDKVSIAKIRLVPITVSQLKCALHILIGDWYDNHSEEKVFTHDAFQE